MRVNKGQEFVIIAGYTPSDRNLDARVIGYYENENFLYAGRTRNGFPPPLRADLMKGLRLLQTAEPNLPEKRSGRWAQG
jgi:ATP-dependent DNA ligase